MKVPVTVFVLTLNEEEFIERCIDHVIGWADEVLVVDSGSKDRTRELAAAKGARVIDQPWLGWVQQHHAGMDAARNDWCMKVDADEIVDDELGESVVAALSAHPDPMTGFVVTRAEEFCSRLMPNIRRKRKRDTFVRLMNKKYSRYKSSMLIHEEMRVTGALLPLPGRLLHWRAFSLDGRFQQDIRNATLEAKMMHANGVTPAFWRILMMPIFRFLWRYIGCGSWRLGRHGLVFSMSSAVAEFMRQAKLWELIEVQHLRHPPAELLTKHGGRGFDARRDNSSGRALQTPKPDS